VLHLTCSQWVTVCTGKCGVTATCIRVSCVHVYLLVCVRVYMFVYACKLSVCCAAVCVCCAAVCVCCAAVCVWACVLCE
jgi:hypothetical protein